MLNHRIENYLYFCLMCLTVTKISWITCAPLSADEMCSVDLQPNTILSKRNNAEDVTINCKANLDSKLLANGSHFSNPVFDLSFGGAPRTGVFIIRGNATCSEAKTKCFSEFKVDVESIGNLIQYSDSIAFTCQVADQLRNVYINSGHARCESAGKLQYSKELYYGDRCNSEDIRQECGEHMECGVYDKEFESESESQCICIDGYTSLEQTEDKTICVQQIEINGMCNYSLQCDTIDAQTVCKANSKGIKVCQCKEAYYYSVDENACRKKSRTTTVATTTTEIPVVVTSNTTRTSNATEESHAKIQLIPDQTTGESLTNNSVDGTQPKSKNKNKSGSNTGIIFFFLAILLAILIVVIIIRVRNKSDKRTITKKAKRTEKQQTDNKDGEQSKPILDNNVAVDEVDDDARPDGPVTDSEQNHSQNQRELEENNNKRNNINSSPHNSEKTQTIV